MESFFGDELAFPLFRPHEVPKDDNAVRFVAALRRADGVIIASPGYHGSVSGLIKNAIDYVELMRDDARPYLEGRPVGCISCAAGWQATASTLSSLRAIVHALRGWPTPLGAMLNSAVTTFTADGGWSDASVASQLSCIAKQVCEFGSYRSDCLHPIIDNSVDNFLS